MKRALKVTGIGLLALVALAASGLAWLMLSTPPVQRLALPPDLVDATTDTGHRLLAGASARTDYAQLAPEFVAQKRRAFCGVASSVTVINAMLHPQPRLNQETLFTAADPAAPGELGVSFSGLTLEQLARLLGAQGARVETTYASQSDVSAFRDVLRRVLAEPRVFLVVNYDRRTLGQEGGGHISPLAAYNAEQDAALVLDVAAHKYPYTWVPVARLWQSIDTRDPESGRSRGYLLVSAPQAAGG